MKTSTLTAKEIRKLLKALEIKARVKAESWHDGDSVTIYTDDLDKRQVQLLKDATKKFQYGYFESYEDRYIYSNRNVNIPQVKYIIVENRVSDETYQILYHRAVNEFPGMDNAPKSYKDARNMVHPQFNCSIQVLLDRMWNGSY